MLEHIELVHLHAPCRRIFQLMDEDAGFSLASASTMRIANKAEAGEEDSLVMIVQVVQHVSLSDRTSRRIAERINVTN